jgi:hypothetical protein
MELSEQTQLIREFMISVAPEITRYTLNSIQSELEAENASRDNARMCLQWSMHLAGAFANLKDEAHPTQAKNPFKAKLEAQSLQREAAPRAPGI